MHPHELLFLFLFLALPAAPAAAFNLTAVSAAAGKSVLECWQLLEPAAQAAQAGIVGVVLQQLGAVANASVAVIPAGFDGGAHVAPAVQYVFFSSGVAHVTLPHSPDEAWIFGGRFGLVLVTDVAAVSATGHITRYPSGEQTAALELPTAGGRVPRHRKLHRGACAQSELEF